MSAEQKQEAVVKPLEWVWFAESSTGYERYEAHTLAGEWWVSVQPDCVELNFPKSLKTEKFCTLEAAKAAAQADYEARIRSALAPAASSQERIAQLEALAQRYYELLRECQSEFRARGADGLVETIATTLGMPLPAALVEAAPEGRWRYSINFGPEGEEDWANLTTPKGEHVANIRTRHAVAIVHAIHGVSATLEAPGAAK